MIDKAKPILFNTDMVRAILDGRKTETRRPMKLQPPRATFSRVKGGHGCTVEVAEGYYMKPPYQPGDILYVRETWSDQPEYYYLYKADCPMVWNEDGEKITLEASEVKWRPSIHMPKEAARIFLRVNEIKVERLQDITDEGAKAEGANWKDGKNVGVEEKMQRSAIERFTELWDRVYGNWNDNPWVWKIAFERIEGGQANV